jgi:hypothetical protein
MAITLTIQSCDFLFPENSANPGWGSVVTDWASKVTTVLSDIQGTNDILTTTACIACNQCTAASVTLLTFSPSATRSFEAIYNVVRCTSCLTTVVPSAAICTTCETFTLACHGLVNGQIGRFTTSCALPTGISLSTCYYVVNVCGATFKISATAGGAAVNLTGAGTGNQTFTRHADVETGIMRGVYNGTTWHFTNGCISGCAGMAFQMTNAGQVQYFSDTKGAGTIKFKASTYDI